MSQSETTIVGNVTNDPELKFMPNGKPRLGFGVAVNFYWTDAAGEKQEKTSYFNVVAWGPLADDSANVLEKGVGVIVSGRLEQRSWDDKETGQKKSTVEINAGSIAIQTRSIESFERKRRGEGGTQAKSAASPRAKQAVITEDSEPF
jgi:single-strand DNA-binding protein